MDLISRKANRKLIRMMKREAQKMNKAAKGAVKPVPYFYIQEDEQKKCADVYVFGEITSFRFMENDVSSYSLASQLQKIPPENAITLHINSLGGEVQEGLAIYNVCKTRNNVKTVCEGFAASAASLIFCGGSERVMQPASLLFIHNAWENACGNSDDLKKAAADLEIINSAAKAAYKEAGIKCSDDDLDQMMNEETWILPEEAVTLGLATSVDDSCGDDKPKQSAMNLIQKKLTAKAPETESVKVEINADAADAFFNTFDQKTKDFIDQMKASTNPTPKPAKVENKGFFNFKHAGENGKEDSNG